MARFPANLDSTTRTILRHIQSLGYAVRLNADGTQLVALKDEERHEVAGDDPYHVACRLAEAVGIDLEDG